MKPLVFGFMDGGMYALPMFEDAIEYKNYVFQMVKLMPHIRTYEGALTYLASLGLYENYKIFCFLAPDVALLYKERSL